MKERLLAILDQYWGYKSFRPMQYEIVSSVMSGADTLALLPTGGGKSITYQLPTLASEGLCIVITPLIALMKDQVDALQKRGISAVAIHSGLSRRKIDIALDNCVYGDVKFLYISPERIATDIFQLRVRRMDVSMIAVDEAHCISQWGYDFRPSYLTISSLRRMLPGVPVLALTASATESVAEDIMEKLLFEKKNMLRSSFSRPNLSYVVRHVEDRDGQLVRILQSVQGSAIVYARKRETTERVCQHLVKNGISASFYHAGLPSEERNIRQDEWVSGKVRVMVATNAFGMGIDKADVRLVVHYTLSDSPESYYQEAGRAGRDMKRSYAVLFVAPKECDKLTTRIENSFPPIEQVKSIYEKICSYLTIAIGDGDGVPFNFNIHDFCHREHLQYSLVESAIDLLERNQYMTYVEESDSPARVIFKVSRDELYKCEMTPVVERVVRCMLRMYNGLFSEFRAIDEQAIAVGASCSIVDVRQSLKDLWRRSIIRYVPANNSPLIYMNEERLPLQNIYIAPETYTKRKDNMLERFGAMIRYAENTTQCRSVMLENYFGDTQAKPCGVCDICLAMRKNQRMDEICEQILRTVQSGECEIRKVSVAVSASPELFARALRTLADRGDIVIDEAGRITIQN